MRRLLLLYCLLVSLACSAQTYKRLTNLPHVIIDTEGKKSVTSKYTYIYATMHYVNEQDSVAVYDSMQIRGRGNSTWNLSKKPYRIKFNNKEKFLGKGYAKAKSWTLMANAADKSLMRNAITSMLGDFLGLKNNPAHQFCDLTLNGTYLGTYQISDQIEVRPHRVNITEQDYPLADTSNISGGYLLELDGFSDGNYFSSSKGIPVRIHYPDEDEIATSQTNYIKQYVNNFEKRLFSTSFQDSVEGYRPLVDSTSLCNWFLATEISANLDGNYSTYFYKEQDDPHLYWGPLWDYDIAYNNDWRVSDTRNLLMADDGFGTSIGKVWVKQLLKDPWFCGLVTRAFQDALQNGVLDYMNHQIDSIASLLQESQQLNYKKWGISTRMYHEIVLYSSYDQYVNDIKSFLAVHLPFLSTALAEKLKNATPETPTPTPSENTLDCEHWYSIRHLSSDKSLAVNSSDKVVLWETISSDSTQLWRLRKIGDYYMLINQKDEKALNDPTEGAPTATTLTGATLDVATMDSTDTRQQWTLTPQDNGEDYNLTNLFSNHTANLSSGNTQNGTNILSYTTNERNATSTNRKWKFVAMSDYVAPTDTVIPDPLPEHIASAEPTEYALAYNPTTHTLHFGSETPELLTFHVTIYTQDGRQVRQFNANETCHLSGLSQGVYIIHWTVAGKSRSTKLLLTQ